RVLFPVMSRVQDNKERLRSISQKLLYYQTMLLAPVMIGMMFALPLLVTLIPQYTKWQPAIPLFYIFALSSLIVSFSAPFMALFNALGKVKITFTFMLLITIVTWILTPILTKRYQEYGFPITHLIVSCALGLILLKVRSTLDMKILPFIFKPLLSSAGMAVILFGVQKLFPEASIPLFIIISTTGAVSYFAIMTYIFNTNIYRELVQFKNNNE
ncbi:MAG: polysaccharide biosynthesis C-terminal domain-containing protein, partial [Microgenomates group bacterium]